MTAYLSPVFGSGTQLFNNGGAELVGGKIFVYQAGTNTPIDTWTTSTQQTKNANPIILDATGRVVNQIWLQGGNAYKFILQDPFGNQIGSTWDNIVGINDPSSNQSQWISTGLAPTYINANQFSVLGNYITTFTVPRRIQAIVTAGIIYGTISASTYSAGFTIVTVTWDSTTLDAGLTQVNVANIFQLSANLSASSGSSLVGFQQAGTGAVAETVQSKLQQFVSVKDFGAIGNGSTDDTTAIQTAITAVQGTSVALHFPSGTYKVSSTLNVTGALSIIGESRYGTSFIWTSTTLNVLSIASDSQFTCEKTIFNGPLLGTAGNIISLNGSATQNIGSIFRDCAFSGGYNHIATGTASDWSIENCLFSNYISYGLYVSDTYNPDAGDSYVGAGSTFSTTTNTAIGIFQQSSGGLKIEGNKIVGGAYGYQLQLATVAPSTIDLILVGNSIENQATANVLLSRPAGALTFGNVVIVGNQLSNSPIGIQTDSNAGWLSRINITGNQITLPSVNGTCIGLGSPSYFLVDGNELYGQSGTTYGIAIGAGATYGKIGVNGYHNLSNNISNGATGIIGSPIHILANSGTSSAAPADTNEDVLATITVPAKSMGLNGAVRVTFTAIMTNSVNNKTLRVRFGGIGGTAFYTLVATANDSLSALTIIQNSNNTGTQILASAQTASGLGLSTGALPTGAIDTTADTTIVITGQKASAGEALVLKQYMAELLIGNT